MYIDTYGYLYRHACTWTYWRLEVELSVYVDVMFFCLTIGWWFWCETNKYEDLLECGCNVLMLWLRYVAMFFWMNHGLVGSRFGMSHAQRNLSLRELLLAGLFSISIPVVPFFSPSLSMYQKLVSKNYCQETMVACWISPRTVGQKLRPKKLFISIYVCIDIYIYTYIQMYIHIIHHSLSIESN